MADKPRARRCSVCDHDWPNTSDYEECPLGHGETWLATDQQPLTLIEAQQLVKKYRDFEEFYAKREEEQRRQAVEDLIDLAA